MSLASLIVSSSYFRALQLFVFTALLALPSFAAAFDVPGTAVAAGALDEGEPRVEAVLLVDQKVVRPGDTFQVGVLFQIEPEWHIYWRNSGQGGMSTEVKFSADEVYFKELQWPAPNVYEEAGGEIITFGYSDQVLLFAQAQVGDTTNPSLKIFADIDYLVCKVNCIPGQARLEQTILMAQPGFEQDTKQDAKITAVFAEANARMPVNPASSDAVTVQYSHQPIGPTDEFRIKLRVDACLLNNTPNNNTPCEPFAAPPASASRTLVFDEVPQIDLEVISAQAMPDSAAIWEIELQGRANPDKPAGDARFSGVLLLTSATGRALPTNFDFPLPRTDQATQPADLLAAATGAATTGASATAIPPTATTTSSVPWWQALLLAFFGGMLLNLMPCVFPVLGIKVFALIDLAHKERQSIYVHSLAYTAGIVASLLVLASIVIGLKFAGTQVGWGFQFQEPLFVAGVGAVLVIFALNLFGVFEIGVQAQSIEKLSANAQGPRRSFGEGILAVILATPCSAPFLGTAVGFALTSSPVLILLTFTVLGLGLAAPFVALSLIPSLSKWLPRPGPWLLHFKQVLGFFLLGTVIWLAWIFGQMNGVDGIVRLLMFLFAASLAAWIYGAVQYKMPRTKYIGSAIAAAILILSAWFTLGNQFAAGNSSVAAQTTTASNAPLDWQPFDNQAIADELAAGRPVFVDFTADWCITCQVNKSRVLHSPEVVEAFEKSNTTAFIADWTRRDERIRLELEKFGKAGVPLYLVYSPDRPNSPEVLPELLTRARVMESLQKAARKP